MEVISKDPGLQNVTLGNSAVLKNETKDNKEKNRKEKKFETSNDKKVRSTTGNML